MKTIRFISHNKEYATFNEGGYAHKCLADFTFRDGLVLKKGGMMIYDENNKVAECITKEEFEVRYGLCPVRNGA